MQKASILLLNENERQLSSISGFLSKENYSVTTMSNRSDFQQIVLKTKTDLIIIAIDSTLGRGLEVFQDLRKNRVLEDIFIMMSSQKHEDYIRIMALDSGADDFWVQPIAQRVILKRILALLKRKKVTSLYTKSDFYIDFERFLIIKSNKEITLPKKEFQIISLLYSKPERIFSREEIKRLLWENIYHVQTRAIDVHIRKIREKISENMKATIQGKGYKLEVA